MGGRKGSSKGRGNGGKGGMGERKECAEYRDISERML